VRPKAAIFGKNNHVCRFVRSNCKIFASAGYFTRKLASDTSLTRQFGSYREWLWNKRFFLHKVEQLLPNR
jgi:hypothetical protein